MGTYYIVSIAQQNSKINKRDITKNKNNANTNALFLLLFR